MRTLMWTVAAWALAAAPVMATVCDQQAACDDKTSLLYWWRLLLQCLETIKGYWGD